LGFILPRPFPSPHPLLACPHPLFHYWKVGFCSSGVLRCGLLPDVAVLFLLTYVSINPPLRLPPFRPVCSHVQRKAVFLLGGAWGGGGGVFFWGGGGGGGCLGVGGGVGVGFFWVFEGLPPLITFFLVHRLLIKFPPVIFGAPPSPVSAEFPFAIFVFTHRSHSRPLTSLPFYTELENFRGIFP